MSEKKSNDSENKKDILDNLDNKKLGTFTFNDPNANLKNLMVPGFLGSFHMKESIEPNNLSNVNNLVQNKLDMKLKSAVFNPITLTLIFLALAFNIFWLFLILFG